MSHAPSGAYLDDADSGACTAFCVRLADADAPTHLDRPFRLRVREGSRLVLAVDDEGVEAGEQPAPHVLQLRGVAEGAGVWVVGWISDAAPLTLALEAVAGDASPRLIDLDGLARHTPTPPASWWSAVVSPLESARLLHALQRALRDGGPLPDPAADLAAFARRFTQCSALLDRVGAYRARNEACARLRAHHARHVGVAWDSAARAMCALVGLYAGELFPRGGELSPRGGELSPRGGDPEAFRDLYDHM